MKHALIYLLIIIGAMVAAIGLQQVIIGSQIDACSENGGVFLRTPLSYECVSKTDICSM